MWDFEKGGVEEGLEGCCFLPAIQIHKNQVGKEQGKRLFCTLRRSGDYWLVLQEFVLQNNRQGHVGPLPQPAPWSSFQLLPFSLTLSNLTPNECVSQTSIFVQIKGRG